jgi:hypothetical protein
VALQTVFKIIVNDLPSWKEFNHYPTEEEIETEMLNRFPNGFIDDQFSNEKIYPIAKVDKYYKLKTEGD